MKGLFTFTSVSFGFLLKVLFWQRTVFPAFIVKVFLSISLWKSNLVCGSSLKTSCSLWGHSITCLTRRSRLLCFSSPLFFSVYYPLLFFYSPLFSFLLLSSSLFLHVYISFPLFSPPLRDLSEAPSLPALRKLLRLLLASVVERTPWSISSARSWVTLITQHNPEILTAQKKKKQALCPPFSVFFHVLCSFALPCFPSQKNPQNLLAFCD